MAKAGFSSGEHRAPLAGLVGRESEGQGTWATPSTPPSDFIRALPVGWGWGRGGVTVKVCVRVQMHPEASCAPRQPAHRLPMLPHAEEAWSRPGPSPTSHPWGGPSSNAGAWGLLRQEKSRRERGRGQARSEQGHRPLSPAPEEGAPGTGASQVARGCEPDPLHSAPRTGKQAGQHLCPLHPAETWSAPGHTVRGGQTQGGPGRLPVPRGGTDKGVSRYGGASAVHERKHTLHAQHCSLQFFLSM